MHTRNFLFSLNILRTGGDGPEKYPFDVLVWDMDVTVTRKRPDFDICSGGVGGYG